MLVQQILNEYGGLDTAVAAEVADDVLFKNAFTHPSIEPVDNYEILEFHGDSVVNMAIVNHLVKRFPEHFNALGVKIFARLKINLISRKSLAGMAFELGLQNNTLIDVAKWNATSVKSVDALNLTSMKVLEDVFEALFGAIVLVLDNRLGKGLGNVVATRIIDELMSARNISVRDEDLFDAKTRLKEVFDSYRTIGRCTSRSLAKTPNVLVSIILYRPEEGCVDEISTEIWGNTDASHLVLGHGSALIKIDAEQEASKIAIATLASFGVKRSR